MTQTYISPSRTFSLEYPDNWKLEREEGGIIALQRKDGLLKRDSHSVLRIKPLVSDKVISPQTYDELVKLRRKEHLDLEINEKSDLHLMNFHIIKYRQEGFQDIGEKTFQAVQYYWELLIYNRIFNCCFTVLKEEEESPKTREEKETAEKILYSIKLL
jgi:hypothetical protein